MKTKSVNFSTINVTHLGALICQLLGQNDIDTVLTGGSCVTIYSKNHYVSMDLDFVPSAVDEMGKIERLLKGLKFKRKGRHFVRHDCAYLIEFVNPPLAVGREKVGKIHTIKTAYGVLRLISPTDCVKDRLAAYFHWEDKQALQQALLVSRSQRVNQREIRRWSSVEDNLMKYKEYLGELKLRK